MLYSNCTKLVYIQNKMMCNLRATLFSFNVLISKVTTIYNEYLVGIEIIFTYSVYPVQKYDNNFQTIDRNIILSEK